MGSNQKKIVKNSILHKLGINDLEEKHQELVRLAIKALENAYAPYSGFKVGASVLLEDGQIYSANNQENVCFPVGVCAERILLGFTHGNFPSIRPVVLAIAAKKADGSDFATVTPCGLCRQSISEYEMKFKKPIEILMYAAGDHVYRVEGMDQLLPFKFEDLNH